MGFATFPSSTLIFNNVSNSFPSSFNAKTSHNHSLNLNKNSQVFIGHSFFDCGSIRDEYCLSYKGLSLATLGDKNSCSGDGDKRALETVLKLYDAIRERNMNDLSDIIGEECRCVCNFIAAFQPCYGKKQVLFFFATLMKNLGSKIQFEVEPTSHDGMNVGISWKLEWSKNGIPLGKGFSFYVCHVYQGKVMIRNVEMFMEPLFHFEPFRLKMVGFVMNVMDKIGTNAAYKTKLKTAKYLSLAFPMIITLFFFTRIFSY